MSNEKNLLEVEIANGVKVVVTDEGHYEVHHLHNEVSTGVFSEYKNPIVSDMKILDASDRENLSWWEINTYLFDDDSMEDVAKVVKNPMSIEVLWIYVKPFVLPSGVLYELTAAGMSTMDDVLPCGHTRELTRKGIAHILEFWKECGAVIDDSALSDFVD